MSALALVRQRNSCAMGLLRLVLNGMTDTTYMKVDAQTLDDLKIGGESSSCVMPLVDRNDHRSPKAAAMAIALDFL
jgi:hypothetical protein